MHKGNPEVIRLSSIVNRSPSSITFKLGNFARLDPELQKRNIKGLSHGSKSEIEIWNEFNHDWENLSYESELLLAKKKGKRIEQEYNLKEKELPLGKEREAIVKVRVNQSFFRDTILASYDSRCCITGISVPALLTASHIIPWSENSEHRMNPSNGLCLNALHDRAFDKGLITITSDFSVKLSSNLFNHVKKNNPDIFFSPFKNKKIMLPHKFLPDKSFLEYHYKNIFQK